MKHPDTVKADTLRTKASAAEDEAADYKQSAGVNRGVAPKLAEAYEVAAFALESLAAAMRERAAEFDESARLDRR